MRKIIFIFLVVMLSGCETTWKKAELQGFTHPKMKFTAQLPVNWMYFSNPKMIDITKDGELLNDIFVETVGFNTELSATKKRYKPNMLMDELAEVDIDNLRSNASIQHFDVFNNQMTTLGGEDAYRFEIRYQTSDGLKKKGIVYGTKHHDRFYRIGYMAAEQYYYDLHRKSFEKFIQSFQFSD